MVKTMTLCLVETDEFFQPREWTAVKTKHRKIATRQWTRRAVGFGTRSTFLMNRSLSIRVRPPLRKRDKSLLQKKKLGRSFEPMVNIVGHRISHGWEESNETVTQWNAIVLYQMPTCPSLYLMKYDGIDCVYGLELHSDERIVNFKILSNNVSFLQETNTHFSNTIFGRAVKHNFEGKNGFKDEWKGTVLEEVPVMKSLFYITYANHPVLYIYCLLDDYIEGNLHIMPECSPVEVTSEVDRDVLTGLPVKYNKRDGTQKRGKIIYQVPTKPSVYFIKFDNDIYIYVCELERSD